ncbi:copper resistance protein CopZ [Rhodobacteraceae bacterium CCMM004]|nr:copper resistance protein CopZ [Rhodobacteraceae bacterium CCMM004]
MRAAVILTVALAALGACRDETAEAPAPAPLTAENVSFFCQMNVLEHGGPKAQIHLAGYDAPLFFAQVRDAVAYLKSPEREAPIRATYVSDMGAAPGWNAPGTENWTAAETAHFVVEAGVAGGMGAPEVVPFARAEDAAAFVGRYGGRVVALTDIPDDAVLGPVDPAVSLEVPQ